MQGVSSVKDVISVGVGSFLKENLKENSSVALNRPILFSFSTALHLNDDLSTLF